MDTLAGRPPTQGQIVWTPPADVRERSEIGRYLGLAAPRARPRLRRLRRPVALVGRRPRGLLVVALGLLRDPRARAVRARARVARDAGRGVVPRRAAELRRAHGRPRRGCWRGRGRRALAVARAARAHVRRAARAGRARPRRPAAARRRPRRPRRRVPAEHPGDARRVPRRRRASARSGRRVRRSSASAACCTGSASSSRRSCSPSPATAGATGSSTVASRWPPCARGCRAWRPSSTSPTRAAPPTCSPARTRGTSSWRSRGRSSSIPCRSRTRSTSSSPPARRACRRRSSTATAASCWST